MNRTIAGFFWISLYLLIVLVPVFLMLVPPVPAGRAFWLEFSVALGFVGLTQIAVQFILIARFKRVTAPYGIDIILQYHRQIALIAVAAIVAHPIILVIDNPSRLKLLNPLLGNWASRAAWVSVFSLVAIVISSQFRERLKIDYEWWRTSHLALGVLAIVSAQLHVSLAGLYTNTAWKQAVWIAIAAVMVGLAAYLRILTPALQRDHWWRVAEVRAERGNTHTLVLEPVNHRGMGFRPGQFAWLKLGPSPYTLEEHPFSFSSSAERTDRVEFGIKALGDFTGAIATTPPGTPVYMDGPHGAFSIDRYQAPGYVFIGGGVGITPIMSFLRTMADRGDRRPVLLLYADKTWEGVAYREAIEALSQRLDLRVLYVLEQPEEGWTGERGFINGALLERHLPERHSRMSRIFVGCRIVSDHRFVDYYEVLQLSPNASAEVIERVYRALAKRYHPDNRETGDVSRFTEVHAAFETLSSPAPRAAYDVKYDENRALTWKIFKQEGAGDHRAEDRRLFHGILSLLYIARRRDPQNGGLGGVSLEKMLACPQEHLEFPLWYLKQRGWIERLESGYFAITADGVDKLGNDDLALPASRLLSESSLGGEAAAPADAPSGPILIERGPAAS